MNIGPIHQKQQIKTKLNKINVNNRLEEVSSEKMFLLKNIEKSACNLQH